MKTGWTVALAVAACLCQSPAAWCQETATSKKRFNQGVALAKQKQYEAAISVWLDVLDELDEEYVPKAHKALGLACKKLGMLPEAWHHLTLYLKTGVNEDLKAVAWLEQVEGELAKTHRRVAISCDPAGTKLYFGQSAEGPAYHCPLTWWFPPGKRHVHATKEGCSPKTVEVHVRERGEQGGHTIRLAGIAKEPETGATNPPDGPVLPGGQTTITKPVEPKPRSKALEWVLIGSGAAVAVAGGIFHGMAHSKNEDLYGEYKQREDPSLAEKQYDAAYDDEVLPKEVVAYVLYGLGGAAVVTGIVLMAVRHGRSREDGSPLVLITPMPLCDGAGAMVTFDF